MSSIGDLFIKVLADLSDFNKTLVKEAEKSGDQAGQVAGQSLSKTLAASVKTNGAKILGGALATGFALAAAGANQLAEATARFASATGAGAEEATKMIKAVNQIAGDTRQSLESVTEIAIEVKNQMGATGDEAIALTRTFADFARVTRQDGVASVKAFDDILDSWGLTAASTNEIMNKLIVSQHKFGGDLTETQQTLASLAPAMKAANLTIDDGIALLGLFGSKGLDATAASAAFAKALTKVKSPQELQDLITDISNTADPFLRASKAADLFGARAGAKLANALGGAHLDDYKISVEEADGALQKAADTLDSTFQAQIAKKISQITAAIREFGASFGPALLGAAGLASLLAPIGGGKLVKSFIALGPLIKKAIVNSILSAIVPATIAGETVGVAASEGVATGMAGSKAMGIANKVLGPLGKVWGSILGKAFVLGALAVIGVELWQQLQDLQQKNAQQQNDIGQSIGNEIAAGTVEGLQQSKAALEKGISDLTPWVLLFGTGSEAGRAQAELKRQLDEVNKAIPAAMQDAAEKQQILAHANAERTANAYIDGIESKRGDLEKALETTVVDTTDRKFSEAVAEGLKSGRDVITAYAKGILEKQSVVKDAFAALLNQQETELSTADEEAYLIGVLTSKQLAAGLKDGRQGVRLQAEATQQAALERLNELARSGIPLGKKAMDQLAAGLKSKNPTIRKTAEATAKIIKDHSSAGTKKGGENAGDKINSGLKSKKNVIGSTAYLVGKGIAEKVAAGIIAQAQRDYGSVGHPGRATGGPVVAGQPYIVGERRPELFVPEVNGHIYPNLNNLPAQDTPAASTNITVALPTTARPDPFEVATQLRRLADLKLLSPRAFK